MWHDTQGMLEEFVLGLLLYCGNWWRAAGLHRSGSGSTGTGILQSPPIGSNGRLGSLARRLPQPFVLFRVRLLAPRLSLRPCPNGRHRQRYPTVLPLRLAWTPSPRWDTTP